MSEKQQNGVSKKRGAVWPPRETVERVLSDVNHMKDNEGIMEIELVGEIDRGR